MTTSMNDLMKQQSGDSGEYDLDLILDLSPMSNHNNREPAADLATSSINHIGEGTG